MNIPPELTDRMVEKSDAELQLMFAKAEEWTPQALDAARAELQKRSIAIPKLPPPPPQLSEAERRKKRLKRDGWLLLIGGLIASSIVERVNPANWFSDYIIRAEADFIASSLVTACLICGINHFIRAAGIWLRFVGLLRSIFRSAVTLLSRLFRLARNFRQAPPVTEPIQPADPVSEKEQLIIVARVLDDATKLSVAPQRLESDEKPKL